MKRKLGILLMTALLVFTFCLSGCTFPEQLPEYDGEYFRYAVRTEKGKKKGYLVGLTELGQEQTELILPQEIDGVTIAGIGYIRKNAGIWSDGKVGHLYSDNLKKLYIPPFIKNWEFNGSKDFENCNNVRIYYSRNKFGRKADIVSYSTYKQLIDPNNKYDVNYVERLLLANISYMFNYENAENDGYYWLDSYDNALITLIPPKPERKGYIFGGWYKEPECINVWNFETDKTSDELLVDDNIIPNFGFGHQLLPPSTPPYNETDGIKLFAKWIKN